MRVASLFSSCRMRDKPRCRAYHLVFRLLRRTLEEGRLRFSLLGPLEITGEDGALAVGGPRRRALLALLLLHANTAVSRHRLIHGLWGDRPPETAANALQVAVHGLRKLLGPERIVTHAAGYLLRVEPDELDLDRFESLVVLARTQEPAQAAATLATALALWRGEALADLGDAPFATAAAGRLEETRLVARAADRAGSVGGQARRARAGARDARRDLPAAGAARLLADHRVVPGGTTSRRARDAAAGAAAARRAWNRAWAGATPAGAGDSDPRCGTCGACAASNARNASCTADAARRAATRARRRDGAPETW